MRISDWSSDVCSSDLVDLPRAARIARRDAKAAVVKPRQRTLDRLAHGTGRGQPQRVARVPRGFDRVLQVGRHEIPQGEGKVSSQSAMSVAWKSTWRSEEHTSELQSLMRISYAV